MPDVNPAGNEGELTLSEAVQAYANPKPDEEAEKGQSEPGEIAESEAETETAEADEETGDTEEEGQAEEETEEPAAPAYAPKEAKVKLENGEEVTVDDLIKGNLRDRDYRQKTEAVAAEKKAYAAKSEQIQQLEQQVEGDRQFMAELLQSIMPEKPDATMASVDPVGYVEAKARHEAFKERVDYLLSQQNQTAQRRTAEQSETFAQTRAREWEATLEKMPELKDSTRLTSFVSEISRHGQEYGYTAQELQSVGLDHRQVLVLRDAIAWRKLQESKSKVQAKVEGRPPVQRGGTRQSVEGAKTRDVRVAMERLTKSGSIRDGVAALLALEKG